VRKDNPVKIRVPLVSIPRVRPVALLVGCALTASVALQAARAQAPAAEEGAARPPSVWVEPSISAGATVSSNGGLSSGNTRDEQTLEISPGVRVVANTPRVRGYLDYNLRALTYLQGTSDDDLRHRLNAQATVNAWDQRLLVDLAGSIDDELRSALGAPSSGSLSDANRSSNTSLRFSPYWRSRLWGSVDSEFRYALQSSNSEAADRADLTAQTLSASLSSIGSRDLLGWTASALSQDVDYDLGRDTRSDSVQAGLIIVPDPRWRITLSAGRERNDIITLEPESYGNNAISVDWQPSTRSRALVEVQDRYFGTGHNVLLEHRGARTVWRYTDSRGQSNSGIAEGAVSLGSVYDLLDSLYSSLEPDPIRRAQLVQAELQRLGLPADSQLLRNYQVSSATLDRRQQASVALVGRRSVITLAFSRSNSERLSAVQGLGDDFDQFSNIARQGWSLSAGHRLTPLTALNASLSRERTTTNLVGFDTRVTAFTVGLATRLAERTAASLQFRRSVSDGGQSRYRDTSIAAAITHRF
jgi:uncharacterized protein (PEP-CTERM system associated)